MPKYLPQSCKEKHQSLLDFGKEIKEIDVEKYKLRAEMYVASLGFRKKS
jgi:hypothetical protein